jgi:hypothetical protein
MTQTVDFRFELLFVSCVLISLISLFTAALMLKLCGRRSAAKWLLKALGIGWVAYLSIVFIVSAATPQRIIPMYQDLCFDEMCFAVVDVQTVPHIQAVRANGMFYIVTVRMSSHARGRAQSERGLRARLWSPRHEYQISVAGQSAWETAHAQTVALTTRLRPGQSILSEQVFDIPTQATDLGLVLSNGFTPGYFVIGECGLFHNPTIFRLSP